MFNRRQENFLLALSGILIIILCWFAITHPVEKARDFHGRAVGNTEVTR